MPRETPHFDPDRFAAIAIGSSTGGPNLVQRIITGLPADMPCPIFIAQHLPPKFTKDMALAMNHKAALNVVEAENDMPVIPGTVYIGKGRMHMRVRHALGKQARIQISEEPVKLHYKPSADELFDSCVDVYGQYVLGIVMTGIGRDGVEGAARIVESGGVILTQAKATCAVYGMPRACDEAGLSSASLTPDGIRDAILQLSPTCRVGLPGKIKDIPA